MENKMEQNQNLKLSERMNVIPIISFTQTTCGEHFIRDMEGNEIKLDVNKLDCADIQHLLNGLANIFTSLSSALWNKNLVNAERDI